MNMKVSLKEVKKVRDNLNCYVVGEVFRQSLEMAKDVKLANELGLEVVWEYEQEDWMIFAGDPFKEYAHNFVTGKWECFHAYVKDDSGYILSSLGGIVLSKDADRTGYEHELLSEAVQELKRGRSNYETK